MKVGFFGAQGTGKSTIFDIIKTEYPFNTLTDMMSISGKLTSDGIKISEGGSQDLQLMMYGRYKYNLYAHENLLSDRTPLCPLAYTLYNFWNGYTKFDPKFITFLCDETKEMINQYDYLFWTRPEFEIVDNGIRSVDKAFQTEIDMLYEDILVKFKMKDRVHLLTGTVENRLNIIKKVIPEYNGN